MFKTKREKELEELVALLQAKGETKEVNPSARFVSIPVPQPNDMGNYWKAIADLGTNPLYLFYLSQLRRDIVDNFETQGENRAEYFRGMLAAIGQIFQDADKAKRTIEGANDAV